MSMLLKDGTKVKAIYFADKEESVQTMSNPAIEKMYISMENGQMDRVPWVVIEFTDGATQIWNCAVLMGLEVIE